MAVARTRTTAATSSSDERRKQLLDQYRAIAANRLQNTSSGGVITGWDGKYFSKKAGTKTLISVIPTTVYSYNIDEVPVGLLTPRFSYNFYEKVGGGEVPHVAMSTWRKGAMDALAVERARLSKESYSKNEERIKKLKPKIKSVHLFYDHDAKEVLLYDDSYYAFGRVIDKRVQTPTRAGQDLWTGYFLAGDQGLALEIQWDKIKIKESEWTAAINIDFYSRNDYPVPPEIFEKYKNLDLSTKVKKSTPEEIEKDYLELGDEAAEEVAEEATQEVEPEREKVIVRDDLKPEEADIPFEIKPPVDTEITDENIQQMDKEALLKFASGENPMKIVLKWEGKEIAKAFRRSKEDDIFEMVTKAWAAVTAITDTEAYKEEQTAKTDVKCPAGGNIGVDMNKFEQCSMSTVCTDEFFTKCNELHDAIEKKK